MRGHHAHRERTTNEGAENYAKAIYHLQGRSKDPVHTSAVAETTTTDTLVLVESRPLTVALRRPPAPSAARSHP